MFIFASLLVLSLSTACSVTNSAEYELIKYDRVDIGGKDPTKRTITAEYLASETDCPFVSSVHSLQEELCSNCGTEQPDIYYGGLYAKLEYQSAFTRVLDGLRIDFRSIKIDDTVTAFDERALVEQSTFTCHCTDSPVSENVSLSECPVSVTCMTAFDELPSIHFTWVTSFNADAQSASSELTLHGARTSSSNITVEIGFDRSLKRQQDEERLTFGTATTRANLILKDGRGEEQDVKNFDVEVEADFPSYAVPAPPGVELRPPQRVVSMQVPADLMNYSISALSFVDISSASVRETSFVVLVLAIQLAFLSFT